MSKHDDNQGIRDEARLADLRTRWDIEEVEAKDGRIRIVRTGVSSSLLDKIDAECAKLNQRAKRLKLTAPNGGEPVEVRVTKVEWKRAHPKMPAEPIHTVEITGPLVPLIKPGYSLVGILETTDGGLIKPDSKPRLISRVDNGPDNDQRLNEFRDEKQGVGCAHCDKLRYRKRMVLVNREADNKLLAIGSACADEYVELRESVVDFLAKLFEIGKVGPRGPERAPWMFPLKDVIVAALYSYNKRGYVPKRDYLAQQSTASHVEYLLWPPLVSNLAAGADLARWFATYEYQQWETANKAMEAEAQNLGAEADKLIAWVESMNAQNDYQHNLKAAYTTDHKSRDEDGNEVVTRVVTLKTINLAVSGVNAYMKEVEAQRAALAAAANKALPVSKYVGKIGDKLDLKVELDRVERRDGNCGPYTLVEATVLDGAHAGAKVTWFATRTPQVAGADVVKGQKVWFKRTIVKKHRSFRGVEITQITKASVEAVDANLTPTVLPPANPQAPANQARGIKLVTPAQKDVVMKAVNAGDWQTIFGANAVAPTEAEIDAKERGAASKEWLDPIFGYYRVNGWPKAQKAPAQKAPAQKPATNKVKWTDDPVAGTVTAEATFTKADFPDLLTADEQIEIDRAVEPMKALDEVEFDFDFEADE